jgi:hypothetical protein
MRAGARAGRGRVLTRRPASARTGQVGEAADVDEAVEVEQDDEAVVDLGDRLQQLVLRGGRQVLEVGVTHGQDLGDIVDDDAGAVVAGLDDHDLRVLGTIADDAQASARS